MVQWRVLISSYKHSYIIQNTLLLGMGMVLKVGIETPPSNRAKSSNIQPAHIQFDCFAEHSTSILYMKYPPPPSPAPLHSPLAIINHSLAMPCRADERGNNKDDDDNDDNDGNNNSNKNNKQI